MKFSIWDFSSKCVQICSFLQIWSHLLKKSLMENFIFCAVIVFIVHHLNLVFTRLSCFLWLTNFSDLNFNLFQSNFKAYIYFITLSLLFFFFELDKDIHCYSTDMSIATATPWRHHVNWAYIRRSEDLQDLGRTAKNTVISPNFLVWKFCGKVQFPYSLGQFARNYAEIVTFRKISTPGN